MTQQSKKDPILEVANTMTLAQKHQENFILVWLKAWQNNDTCTKLSEELHATLMWHDKPNDSCAKVSEECSNVTWHAQQWYMDKLKYLKKFFLVWLDKANTMTHAD